MINAEEKMKLMVELGLESAAAKWAETNNLTNLKFRPITEEKINDLLSVTYDQNKAFDPGELFGFGILGTLGGMVMLILSSMATGKDHWSLALYGLSLGAAVGCYFGRARMVKETAVICNMPLIDWDDNLPYGALLAVKEAKQQGFKNFTIYFPARQGSYYGNMQRLKNDPIIVATKKNSAKMYNIFAWDDGKVYE